MWAADTLESELAKLKTVSTCHMLWSVGDWSFW